MKHYRLLKDIRNFPNQEIDAGTIGKYHEGYWRFQYKGMEDLEMGNALLVSNPEQYPEWFEEVPDIDTPVPITMREIAACMTNYIRKGCPPNPDRSETVIDDKKLEALFISKLKQL